MLQEKALYQKKELLQKKRQAGFTLVELMIVVAIIGILAAIAMPQFSKATEKAEAAQVMANTRILSQAAQMYYLDTSKEEDVHSITVSQLIAKNYLDVSEKEADNLEKYTIAIENGKVVVTPPAEK